MKSKSFIPMLHLQLFADGGAGTAGGANDGGTAQGTGVTAPAAGVQPGVAQTSAASAAGVQVTEADLNKEFEQLIKGKFKQAYQARVQDTVQKRLKSNQEIVDKFNALAPALEILAGKHGVKAGDVQALVKAIEADDSYINDVALSRGLTAEQYRAFRTIERENSVLRQQQQIEQANREYAGWMQQADQLRQVYPAFDLNAEVANPKFMELLRSNIDMRTAYEVLHKDEIIPAAMQFAAQTVEQKLTNDIIAGNSRPTENGLSAQAPASAKSDVSKLTAKEIDDYIRRIQGGERVSFG